MDLTWSIRETKRLGNLTFSLTSEFQQCTVLIRMASKTCEMWLKIAVFAAKSQKSLSGWRLCPSMPFCDSNGALQFRLTGSTVLPLSGRELLVGWWMLTWFCFWRLAERSVPDAVNRPLLRILKGAWSVGLRSYRFELFLASGYFAASFHNVIGWSRNCDNALELLQFVHFCA